MFESYDGKRRGKSHKLLIWNVHVNTLRPRRNEQYFADDIFKCIFINENVWISIKISLNFIAKGPINNTPALVQIMAWRRPGNKPLSEPMMVSLPTHICVTWPQWVKGMSLPLSQISPMSNRHFQCKAKIVIARLIVNIHATCAISLQ